MAVTDLLSKVKGAANREEIVTAADEDGVMEWEEPEGGTVIGDPAKFTWTSTEGMSWEDGELPGDLLPKDPKPARASEDPKVAKEAISRAMPQKATRAQQKEIRDALVMMITLPAATLAFKDPICGSAILDHADNVADKLVPIVCRNPALMRWFTSGSGYMDYFALAMAVSPIVKTVYGHHVSHSIGHENLNRASDFTDYRAPEFN